MAEELREQAARAGLLDYDGAAVYLGTTERHVRYLWQKRELGAVKIGNRVRFDPNDLAAYVEAHRVPAVR